MDETRTYPEDKILRQVPPVRGLITTHNAKGMAYELTDLKKWMRVNRDLFKAEKVDVLAGNAQWQVLEALLPHANALDVRVSLRTNAAEDPAPLNALAALGLHDVFLCPLSADAPQLIAWIEVCEQLGLPVRLQLCAPFEGLADIEALARRWGHIKVLNLALSDPFERPLHAQVREEGKSILSRMQMLAKALQAQGVEVNLLHFPFCVIEETLWPFVTDWQQFYLDHQQYHQGAYELADLLFRLPPHRARKIIDIRLNQQTSSHNAIDNLVLPWILSHPAIYVRIWALHKLTRHLNFLKHRPQPLPETVTSAEKALAGLRERQAASLGPVCSKCRFRHVCNHDTESVDKRLPAIRVEPVRGEDVNDPLEYSRRRNKYFDDIDAERALPSDNHEALAAEARRMVSYEPPTREITAEEYEIQAHMTHHMPGAIRWYSFANAELQSTPLARLQPPFTLALTFGGGSAMHIGFSFGRHAKIVCPMIAPSHQIVLRVDASGEYALLRDGELVTPTEFKDAYYVPRKLGGLLEPRISIWNIDGEIVTQTLLLWEKSGQKKVDLSKIRYSVMIISTRYARRLQAALLSLAHQQDFDPERCEIIIGYVPGLDATDDIIESVTRTFPALRIVRSPFAPHHAKSKGFMINETVKLASGEWIVLVDSDILLPPRFFAELDRVEESAMFIAPDGRKMLSPDTTAGILLGLIRPWECYDELLASEGELRKRESDGVPIGYCQCARRVVFEQIPYAEFNHFEGADWFFGKYAAERFGKETRLEGVPVLHLDHGGSQWYGAQKQM